MLGTTLMPSLHTSWCIVWSMIKFCRFKESPSKQHICSNKGLFFSSLTGQVFRYYLIPFIGQKKVLLPKILMITPLPTLDSFGHFSLTFNNSWILPPIFILVNSMSSNSKVKVGQNWPFLWTIPHVLSFPHSIKDKL